MKPTPEYIKAIARAAGYDTARLEGSWGDYRVYSGRMFGASDDEAPKIGQPLIILQEGRKSARIASDDEARAYLQAVAAREDAIAEFQSLLDLLNFATIDDEEKRARAIFEVNSGAAELYAYYPGNGDPEPDPEAEFIGGIIDGALYLQPRWFNSTTRPTNPQPVAVKEGK